MKQFQITNTVSGQYLGTYEAETQDDALDALAQDAGYSDYREACEVLGATSVRESLEVTEAP